MKLKHMFKYIWQKYISMFISNILYSINLPKEIKWSLSSCIFSYLYQKSIIWPCYNLSITNARYLCEFCFAICNHFVTVYKHTHMFFSCVCCQHSLIPIYNSEESCYTKSMFLFEKAVIPNHVDFKSIKVT